VVFRDHQLLPLAWRPGDPPRSYRAYLNTALRRRPRHDEPASHDGKLRRILLGDILSPASRQRLETWLVDDRSEASACGRAFPPGWRIATRPAASERHRQHIGILWPPCRPPILAAVTTPGSSAPREQLQPFTPRSADPGSTCARAEWDEMEPQSVPSHPIRAHWRSWFHQGMTGFRLIPADPSCS